MAAGGPIMPNKPAVGPGQGRVMNLIVATCLKLAVEAALARTLGAPVRRGR
jgi:hypothetical protein